MNTTRNNTAVNEYNYTKLSEVQTAELLEKAIELVDRHFHCDGAFIENAHQSAAYIGGDPYSLFSKIEGVFENMITNDDEKKAFDYIIANTTSPFKWYRYNKKTVNLSSKQHRWWIKQLTRYGLDAEFLTEPVSEPTPASPSTPAPRFSELFA